MLKKILLMSSTCCFVCGLGSAFADDSSIVSGPYVGGQIGQSHMNYSDTSYTGNTTGTGQNSADSNKGALRIFGGYNFTQFLAAELGYGYYGKPEIKHPSGNTQDFLQQGIDLDLRINIPLSYGLGIYAKGGANWIHRGSLEPRSGYFADKPENSKIVPLGGLGVSYDINQTWSTDLSWTRSESSGDLPNLVFYGLGVTYKFNSGL
jgi:OOP family OmpA-OmpF porin